MNTEFAEISGGTGIDEHRQRGKFRVGSRTALILVAAAALIVTSTSWVAYHLRWIRERHQILAKYDPERARGTSPDPRVWRRRATDAFSRTLWLFSERPQRVIAVELDSPVGYLPDGLADGEREELDRIAQLFPEAAVLWSTNQNRSICGYLKPPTDGSQPN